MKEGIALKDLSISLERVPPRWKTPLMSLRHVMKKVVQSGFDVSCIWRRYRYGEKFHFLKEYHYLPLNAFALFTDDELCKLHYTSIFTMEEDVRELFDYNPCFRVIYKIINCMWRWSISTGTWNEVVDAYDHVRNFTLHDVNDDFSIRLDHSTYCNECGYSQYTRTFLDGVFGFLLHYKGAHVMTIGFSILSDRRILIQQIQLKNKKGNRWIYKLPSNRLAYVIDLFRRNFVGYALYIVDGGSLADKCLRSYGRALGIAQKYEEFDDIAIFSEMIRHLTIDKTRLLNAYADVGEKNMRVVSDVIEKHELRHYRVCVA